MTDDPNLDGLKRELAELQRRRQVRECNSRLLGVGASNFGADIDILAVNGAVTGFICNFGGATGAQPENMTCTMPAGTSYILADLYAGTAPGVIRWTISQP